MLRLALMSSENRAASSLSRHYPGGREAFVAAMNRRHTRADYLDVLRRVRDVRADVAFSSDFIVGFPGESEDDFLKTMSLIEEVSYANAFSFTYLMPYLFGF